MTSTSLSQSSQNAKKNMTSSSLVAAGRLKASGNKSKKTIKTNDTNSVNDSNKSEAKNNNTSADNKNKNNSVTNNKNKNNDVNNASPVNNKKSNDNKNISIFYRPVKRKQPYKPSEVDFHIGVDFESFGKEAPKHTIIDNRQTSLSINPQLKQEVLSTPAPCDYNPVLTPSLVYPTPIHHHISRADASLHGPILVQTEMSNENNRNIDYIDSEIYQTLRNKGNLKQTIGNVEHAPKFYANEMATALSVPGCTFIPAQNMSLNGTTVKIAHKTPTKYETDNPGPGEYRPESKMSSVLSRSPMYQLSGPQFRFDWLEDKRGIPSPNHYNPQKLETSSPQYSIGSKSRINKTTRQKKASVSEESTRIALLNAESRKVVTAPSRSRSRGRYGNASCDSESNYYLPSEESKKNRPKTRNGASAHMSPAYFNERFNQTSTATRREREREKETAKQSQTSLSTFSPSYSSRNYSYNYDYDYGYGYGYENGHRNDDNSSVYSSFYSKCVNVNSNKKNVIPFPVGNFILKLDVNVVPMNDARRYIARHQELVAWVEFILDQVMYDKPDNPLLYVREIFLQIKEQESRKEYQLSDDDLNINQVLVHLKEKPSDVVY